MSRFSFLRCPPVPHIGLSFAICVTLLGVEDWLHQSFPVSGLTDFGRHLLLALAGTFLFYQVFQPLSRRYRETQDVLAAALRRNELILQYASEGIYGLDDKGRLTFVNCAAERMLGYSQEDLGRDLVSEIIPHQKCSTCHLSVDACSILSSWRQGEVRQCDDAVFRRKDGQMLEVRYASAPIVEAWAVTGAVVVFSDNTAQKRNQAVLARWQHIFNYAEWGVIVYDVKADRVDCLNPAFARMHGYTVEELSERPIVELFADDCRAGLAEAIELIHEKGHHVWESWHVRKDGSRFPVQIDATAVRDASGDVSYRVVNVQDITERRRAEDVLRESEAHLARAQSQGRLGSWRLDFDGNVLEWSAECYRIFGLPQGAPITYATFLECVHEDDRAAVDRAWRAAVGGDPYDIQHRIVADGEIRWVRERADLEFDRDGALLRAVGTTQDVTELKHHEDALLRSQLNLRELAAHHEKIREEERTRMAREIHDELGQYLTALRMDTAMLKIRYGGKSPALAEHVEKMKATIDTTIAAVRNLAASLRPGALDMGLVSAAEWLLAGFEERCGVHCHLDAPQEFPEVDEARATAAFRILQESLTNIARYAQASEVHVRIERVNGVLEVDIRDDGVGFDHAEIRSRKTFGLMGMRERALQFGGESKIESVPGAGTTVRIRIPCSRETPP